MTKTFHLIKCVEIIICDVNNAPLTISCVKKQLIARHIKISTDPSFIAVTLLRPATQGGTSETDVQGDPALTGVPSWCVSVGVFSLSSQLNQLTLRGHNSFCHLALSNVSF